MAHQLAVAAERLHHLVVAGCRAELGGDLVAIEELRLSSEQPLASCSSSREGGVARPATPLAGTGLSRRTGRQDRRLTPQEKQHGDDEEGQAAGPGGRGGS